MYRNWYAPYKVDKEKQLFPIYFIGSFCMLKRSLCSPEEKDQVILELIEGLKIYNVEKVEKWLKK